MTDKPESRELFDECFGIAIQKYISSQIPPWTDIDFCYPSKARDIAESFFSMAWQASRAALCAEAVAELRKEAGKHKFVNATIADMHSDGLLTAVRILERLAK